MNSFKIISKCFLFLLLMACSNNPPVEQKKTEVKEEVPEYNPEIGIGAYTSIELSEKLDTSLISKGEKLYSDKCAVCHKLSDEVLTGPGWKNVLSRRTPVWIMNYLTNTNEMLDTDPELIEMIVQYKTRMINYNLNGDEARSILEFMRMNDGLK